MECAGVAGRNDLNNTRQPGLQSKRRAKCAGWVMPLYEEGVFTRMRRAAAWRAGPDQNSAACTKQVRRLPVCGARVAALIPPANRV
jgi:hypothetical protein